VAIALIVIIALSAVVCGSLLALVLSVLFWLDDRRDEGGRDAGGGDGDDWRRRRTRPEPPRPPRPSGRGASIEPSGGGASIERLSSHVLGRRRPRVVREDYYFCARLHV
jgi:hypothetical protein